MHNRSTTIAGQLCSPGVPPRCQRFTDPRPTSPHPRPPVARWRSGPQRIDNLRRQREKASLRHALPPQTCKMVRILGRSRQTGRPAQDDLSLLSRAGRSAKRSSALPPQRPAEVERPAGLGLVRYQRAHLRCTKCGTVGFVDTRVDWTEVINFNKGVC
jgi:hypothetical protein